MSSQPSLEVKALVAGYNQQEIIHDATASFAQGTATAIIGPNGAGKSTLFKAIFGIARSFGGTLSVDGTDVRFGDNRELISRGVSYVPQVRNVFPSLTVRENLSLGALKTRDSGHLEWVIELFPDLGKAINSRGGQLSGGQRNMLAVGRALMADARYLLIDEASGGLSPLAAGNLWSKLGMLKDEGVTIIAVEQNVRMALEFCERVYLMISGRMRTAENSSDLMARVDLGTVFLEGGETELEDAAGSGSS